MEVIITALIVAAAAVFVGWRVWKSLSGKGGCCSGCNTCRDKDCPGSEE